MYYAKGEGVLFVLRRRLVTLITVESVAVRTGHRMLVCVWTRGADCLRQCLVDGRDASSV